MSGLELLVYAALSNQCLTLSLALAGVSGCLQLDFLSGEGAQEARVQPRRRVARLAGMPRVLQMRDFSFPTLEAYPQVAPVRASPTEVELNASVEAYPQVDPHVAPVQLAELNAVAA